jgi:hypothetical protein
VQAWRYGPGLHRSAPLLHHHESSPTVGVEESLSISFGKAVSTRKAMHFRHFH